MTAELGRIMESKEANVDCVGVDQYVLRINIRNVIDADQIWNLGEFMYKFAEGPKGHGEHRKLVIDFGNVDFFAASALNKLLMVNTKLKTRGDELVLANMKPEIEEVFVITKLKGKTFNIKHSVNEALLDHGTARTA